jgi:RNA polymerase sigma factor (sigma-70 family)
VTDADALARYAQTGDSAAFATMVARHIDLVYAAALRQVVDPALAEDVTQATFILLTRKAGRISSQNLAGWLIRAAHYASRDALKRNRRRRFHEEHAMSLRPETVATDSLTEEAVWEELRPHLDAALARLRPVDRTAIALRYIEGRSVQQVAAVLGVSEPAAAKRVQRALSRLRGRLGRHVATSSPAVLALALAGHSSVAAPAWVVANVLGGPSFAAVAIARGAAQLMTLAKLQLLSAFGGIAALLTTGTLLLAQQVPGAPPAPAEPAAAAASAPASAPAPLAARGTLVDEAGRPVPNAAFTVYRSDAFFQTRESRGLTAADGSFALPASSGALDPERLMVFDVPGHALAWWTVQNSRGGRARGPQQPVWIVLHPAAGVAGSVKNQAGAPVAGAAVELEVEERGYGRLFMNAEVGIATLTDGAGNFRVERLPEDARCHVTVTAAGYAPFFTALHYQGSAPPVAAGTTDVEATLSPGATLVAQITRGGKPVPLAGIPVEAWPSTGGMIVERVRTDARGEARFPVLPGKYTAAVRPRAEEPGILASSETDCIVGQEQQVSLEAGEVVRRVSGVVSAGGVPCSQVPVVASMVGERAYEVAVTASDAAGRFTFKLPPGKYTLGAAGLQAGLPQMYSIEVDATAGDVSAAALVVVMEGLWRSQLVDEQQHPLQGTVMRGSQTHTDAAGKFQLAPSGPTRGREIGWAVSDDRSRAIGLLAAPGDALPERLELPRAAVITGRVLDAEGKPPVGPVSVDVGVVISSRIDVMGRRIPTWQSAGYEWMVPMAADGAFRIPTVPVGWDIVVDVTGPDHQARGYALVGTLGAGESRDVGTLQWQAPRLNVGGDPQLSGQAKLTGRIVDAAGDAVVGVAVMYGNSEYGGTSDLKGRFEIIHLPEATSIQLQGRLRSDRGLDTTYWRVSTDTAPLTLTWSPGPPPRPVPHGTAPAAPMP